MEVTTKKQNRRKIVIGVLIAVVVLVAAVIAFASSYLVNYAIGRSGDGGDREVALDVEAPTDGVEQLIAENRAVQKQANEEFLQQNPGQTVQITAADGLRLNGVYYPNVGSHLWVIALHGYRGNHTGVTNLAQHYHDAGYQVLAPDLRACDRRMPASAQLFHHDLDIDLVDRSRADIDLAFIWGKNDRCLHSHNVKKLVCSLCAYYCRAFYALCRAHADGKVFLIDLCLTDCLGFRLVVLHTVTEQLPDSRHVRSVSSKERRRLKGADTRLICKIVRIDH